MSGEKDPRRPIEGILDGLAESIASEAASELLDEARGAGQDSARIAQDLKATLESAVKKFEQRKLDAAREACRAQSASRSSKCHHIAATAEGRKRQLSVILESNPAIGPVLTAQHRDFEALSDGDIESALEDLAELGFLDDSPEPFDEP